MRKLTFSFACSSRSRSVPKTWKQSAKRGGAIFLALRLLSSGTSHRICGHGSLVDPYRPFTKIAKRPSESRKLPFGFAGSRLSFLTPESRDRSLSGKNQFFKLAVGLAASGVSHKCQVRRSSISLSFLKHVNHRSRTSASPRCKRYRLPINQSGRLGEPQPSTPISALFNLTSRFDQSHPGCHVAFESDSERQKNQRLGASQRASTCHP